jgi:tubulin polyglutamylase TTLL6/13
LKFDIRLYVLVTSCEPLKVFIYKEGMVRLATDEWKPDLQNQDNLNNLYMHLTNYAINKESDKFQFGSEEDGGDGHKRLLTAVLESLRES